jgi:hypothetical protein
MADVIQIVGELVQNEYNRQGWGKGHHFNKSRSSMRVEFVGVRYGVLSQSAGKLVTIDEGKYFNSGTEKIEDTFSVNKKTSTTFSYSFKETFGVKVTASLEVPVVGKTGVETSVNFESTQTKGNGEEQSWTHSTKIIVPPKKQVKASFIVEESEFNAPIWGRVRVRGRVFLQSPTWTLPHIEREIDNMLNNGWWPGNFEFEMEGSFVAARGGSYRVQTDESNLPLPTPSGVSGEIKHTVSIIDAGMVRDDGTLQSDFEAWKQSEVPHEVPQ